MATKVYKLNQKRNIAIFDIPANEGKMMVTYTFKDGNQFMPNMPARCVLTDEFYQNLLEQSDLYKRGIIKLERIINDTAKETKAAETGTKVMSNITTSDQLIEFVGDKLGKVFKMPKFALDYAVKQGYSFPKLNME